MKLSLRYRFSEIKRQNISIQDHEVLRFMLLLDRKKWDVVVLNIEDGLNRLTISTDLEFSDSEVALLLNGTFPQIYKYGKVSIKTSNGPHEIVCGNDDENIINLAPCPNFNGNIEIDNYHTSGLLQNNTRLKNWFIENTSLGNIYSKFESVLSITHFGNRLTLDKNSHVEKLKYQSNYEVLGLKYKAVFYFNSNLQQSTTIRHTKFGKLEFSQFGYNSSLLSLTSGRRISIYLEIQSEKIEYYFGDYPILDHKFKSEFENILIDIEKKQNEVGYIEFLKQYDEYQKMRAADLLNARILKLKNSEKIINNDYVIFQKPTCENEVVALFMKLEAAKLLPREIELNVIEYTSKKGIDALGSFRLSRTASYLDNVPIEFEFYLENYFEHEHPVEQTQLIICWDAIDIENIEEIDEVNILYDYMFKIRIDTFSIPVLFLSKLNTFNYSKN
jgi:hypothetical protein